MSCALFAASSTPFSLRVYTRAAVYAYMGSGYFLCKNQFLGPIADEYSEFFFFKFFITAGEQVYLISSYTAFYF